MRKFWIIVLIIILISIVISLSKVLILAIEKGGNFMIWNIGDVERVPSNIRKDEKIDISNINDLSINVKSSDVKLILTDEEQLRVVQYSNRDIDDDKKVKINNNTTSVEIREPKLNIWYSFNIFNLHRIAYDIYIPKNYKNNLDLTSASGDIYLEDEIELKNVNFSLASGSINVSKKINAEDIDIKIVSGDIIFNEIIAKKVNLESISGDISLKGNAKSDKIQVKSTSGDIETKDIETNNIEMKTVSGSIETKKLTADIEMKSTSGDIEIESLIGKPNLSTTSGDISINDFKILKDSNIHSTSGDLKIYLNKESNCNINTKTVSGNVNLPDGKNTIGNEPYNILKLETTSGNINIK